MVILHSLWFWLAVKYWQHVYLALYKIGFVKDQHNLYWLNIFDTSQKQECQFSGNILISGNFARNFFISGNFARNFFISGNFAGNFLISGKFVRNFFISGNFASNFFILGNLALYKKKMEVYFSRKFSSISGEIGLFQLKSIHPQWMILEKCTTEGVWIFKCNYILSNFQISFITEGVSILLRSAK